MKLNSFYLTMAALLSAGSASAQSTSSEDVIMLDLSKATTTLTFDADNGMWTDTFDDDITEIESQVFSIVHGSISDYDYWYGFTASNSVNNLYQSNTIKYQYSNMAKGGILLNDDGTIATNEFGTPKTGQSMPYLVGYPKAEITFNTGDSYELVGAYFNLNSYTFYSILYGDGYARAFTEGDELTLIVHAVDAEENEKTLDVSLASFSNGCLTAATNWKYVDLSSLGTASEIFFTMKGTDSGQWGLNTPSYFCMDKLIVKKSNQNSSVNAQSMSKGSISYDRISHMISLGNVTFALVYDSLGHIVKSASEVESISVEDLPAGIYVVKAGNGRLKFAR